MNKPSYPYFELMALLFASILFFQYDIILAIKLLTGAILFFLIVRHYRHMKIHPTPTRNSQHKKYS